MQHSLNVRYEEVYNKCVLIMFSCNLFSLPTFNISIAMQFDKIQKSCELIVTWCSMNEIPLLLYVHSN